MIGDADVRQAISGTLIEILADSFAAVCDPPLPLAFTLPKALVLAGTCLSQERDDMNALELATARPPDRARVSITTGGGQVCNIYALCVAPSASGKDVGNLLRNVLMPNKLFIGNCGSAEGLADALAMPGKKACLLYTSDAADE